jgi:hypothetical protein
MNKRSIILNLVAGLVGSVVALRLISEDRQEMFEDAGVVGVVTLVGVASGLAVTDGGPVGAIASTLCPVGGLAIIAKLDDESLRPSDVVKGVCMGGGIYLLSRSFQAVINRLFA